MTIMVEMAVPREAVSSGPGCLSFAGPSASPTVALLHGLVAWLIAVAIEELSKELLLEGEKSVFPDGCSGLFGQPAHETKIVFRCEHGAEDLV
jgi:hypothetical protein